MPQDSLAGLHCLLLTDTFWNQSYRKDKPGKGSIVDSKCVLYVGEKDGVVNSVKGSRKKCGKQNFSRVRGKKCIIYNAKEDGLDVNDGRK